MCIIIASARRPPTRDTIRRCVSIHPHGCGFAVARGGKIYLRKGLISAEAIWREMQEYGPGPTLFHSRTATSGSIGTRWCHPFYVGGGHEMALAHNGMIDGLGGEKGVSDTQELVEMLSFLDPAQLPRVGRFLDAIVRPGKLVILRSDGLLFIVGVQRGISTMGDVWYSNESYRPPPAAEKPPPWWFCSVPGRLRPRRQ